MKKVTLVLFAFLLLSACATTREEHFARTTSGVIGCPPEEIKITNIQKDYSYTYYSAECRGKKFRCSQWGMYGDSTPPNAKKILSDHRNPVYERGGGSLERNKMP